MHGLWGKRTPKEKLAQMFCMRVGASAISIHSRSMGNPVPEGWCLYYMQWKSAQSRRLAPMFHMQGFSSAVRFLSYSMAPQASKRRYVYCLHVSQVHDGALPALQGGASAITKLCESYRLRPTQMERNLEPTIMTFELHYNRINLPLREKIRITWHAHN